MFNTISNIEFIINSLLYSVKNEVPGVARGIKKYDLKKLKNYIFCLFYPRDTPGFPQKISAHSVQPYGRLYGTYIQMSCFITLINY